MSELNYVAVKCGTSKYKKHINFNNLYIIHDNFEKKYIGKMCWILLWETDWFTGCFRIFRLGYCQRFEDVYKTSANFAEAYFLSSYRALSIKTLQAKALSPNCWHKHVGTSYLALHVIEYYSQIRGKLPVLLSKKSYTETIRTSFSTQYLCPKLFNVWGYIIASGRFQDWAKLNKVRSLRTAL